MPARTPISDLSRMFLDDGRYLRNWSERTVETYKRALRAFGTTPLTKAGLAAWVVSLRQECGLSVTTTNIMTRAVSSYLSWLHAEGHHPERLRIKQLPNPPKPIKVFSDAEVRRIVTFRLKGRNQPRTWTLLVLMLDTGLRLSEALTLERRHVDLDGLAIKVLGKGHRERWVPISMECRKHLHRLLARTNGDLVFRTASGTGITRHNAHRDIKRVCRAIGIEGAHVHPHAFRHCFAASYVRRGGDIYRLSRILGHSTITTTQLYLRSMGIEHLQEGHEQFSPLTPTNGREARR
jgi:integrase/recombinase XerD